jgi:hypothetical protein
VHLLRDVSRKSTDGIGVIGGCTQPGPFSVYCLLPPSGLALTMQDKRAFGLHVAEHARVDQAVGRNRTHAPNGSPISCCTCWPVPEAGSPLATMLDVSRAGIVAVSRHQLMASKWDNRETGGHDRPCLPATDARHGKSGV